VKGGAAPLWEDAGRKRRGRLVAKDKNRGAKKAGRRKNALKPPDKPKGGSARTFGRRSAKKKKKKNQ